MKPASSESEHVRAQVRACVRLDGQRPFMLINSLYRRAEAEQKPRLAQQSEKNMKEKADLAVKSTIFFPSCV